MLKVMCEWSPGGPEYVRSGWGRALGHAGIPFAFWRPDSRSAFDAFDLYFPKDGPHEGVYLGTTYGDRAVFRCLEERPWLKVGLFAAARGPLTDRLDRARYPIDVATDDEMRRVGELRAKTGQPHFVFLHCVPSAVDEVLGHWRRCGVEPASVPNGADLLVYGPREPRPEFECDAAMVGSRWPYKSKNIDPFILPLCQPDSGLRVKIFGGPSWPLPQYLGNISLEDEAALYSTAKVCLNIHEPHSTSLPPFFDVVERVPKVMACGAALLSDYVEGVNELFGKGAVLMAKTPAEYRSLLGDLLADDDGRRAYGEGLRKIILGGQTYHHRAARLLELLGLPELSARVLDKLGELL